jgi:signal transduction histidine kinase
LTRLQHHNDTGYRGQELLLGNSIAYLIEDEQGFLWIGSNTGLIRVSKKALNDLAAGRITNSLPCRLYGKEDGLLTRECTQGSQPAACRTPDGKMWFSTIKGLVSADPKTFKPNPNPPPVVIESVLVDGEEQNTNTLCSGWLQAITIPAGKELLEIRYTSLNLSARDRALFRYRLEGHEIAWTEAGGRTVAPFSNLPPGHYVFHVIACNEDGVWNETGAFLAVAVLPPFWRTWWFLGLNTAVLLAILILWVRHVSTQKLQRQLTALKQQEALEKERARIARDLHDQLGANLTQVAILGEMAVADKQAPEEVESHARQISQTARETTGALDEIVWAVNPSNDTLEGLITYACKYAQDYFAVTGLRHRLDVPTQLPRIEIPPELRHNVFLAFKEAVNNVVKHAQASETLLRLVLEDSRVVIELHDNGRGPGNIGDKQGRNGLRNMRKRMEDVGGSFSIDAGAAGGTVVRLTVPVGKH